MASLAVARRDRFCLLVAGTLALGLASPAAAQWKQGTINDIQIVNAGSGADGVTVLATFDHPTGCTYQGFTFFSSDPYFESIYALMLTAKATGRPIKYMHVYCLTSGYARGNQYVMVGN